MNYRTRVLTTATICLFILISALPPALHAQVAKKNAVISLRDGLKAMLQNEGAKNMKKLTINVDAEKATELKEKHRVEAAGSYTVYQGIDESGNVMGSVIVISEQGKEGPLQLLVAVKNNGEIYDIGFTVFGEDKGKPVLNWNYLKQYLSKSSSEPLTLGKDIDGISGATWTSESVAFAVKRAAVLYAEFLM